MKIDKEEYPFFNKLKIFGVNRKVIRVKKFENFHNPISEEKEKMVSDIRTFYFDEYSNILLLKDLKLPIEDKSDYRIIIELRND